MTHLHPDTVAYSRAPDWVKRRLSALSHTRLRRGGRIARAVFAVIGILFTLAKVLALFGLGIPLP